MAEQPDPITTDDDLGERLGRAEDRLRALEQEVEALREQLRTVAALGGAGATEGR